MEGAEYKFWIEKLNQMFTKHKVNGWEFWGNDMQNLWGGPYVFGNNGTFESDEKRQAFIDELSKFIIDIYFLNRYVELVSPEVRK